MTTKFSLSSAIFSYSHTGILFLVSFFESEGDDFCDLEGPGLTLSRL